MGDVDKQLYGIQHNDLWGSQAGDFYLRLAFYCASFSIGKMRKTWYNVQSYIYGENSRNRLATGGH